MKKSNVLKCSHFKPMSDLPFHSKEENCNHCAFYNSKSCHKNYYDYLDFPEEC